MLRLLLFPGSHRHIGYIPGGSILTTKSGGMFSLHGKIRTAVLGHDRGLCFPTVTSNGHGQPPEYEIATYRDISELANARNTRFTEKGDLSILENNIIKLWNYENLWVRDYENPHLSEGSSFYASFDKDGNIFDLTTTDEAYLLHILKYSPVVKSFIRLTVKENRLEYFDESQKEKHNFDSEMRAFNSLIEQLGNIKNPEEAVN